MRGKHGYTSPEEYLKDARNFLEKKTTSTIQSFVSWSLADELEGKPKAAEGAAESNGAVLTEVLEDGLDVKIKPSNSYNADAKPRGTVTKITDKMDDATKRSLMRENEAAETIAKNEYDIEQNPIVEGTTRNPDYKIEGELFDCYSPAENTKIRNVTSTIEEKVIEKGQAERVVLNLDDWNGDVNVLVKQLNEYPIEELKQDISLGGEENVNMYLWKNRKKMHERRYVRRISCRILFDKKRYYQKKK